ncbi:MAG: Holliday junction branch migration protein RuvA [Parcubacteria group bacterium CG_4_10_14_0_8_um_filter_35_7]|nr:MAG: Holliday junction branch migration protein RuvA [Parcubacteria group bacterium CG23_combo_of_CG06-09_8_20_14_all_35_9]PIY78835.1 MAG: Holliday junction branch migration protein RuvA [Parcubacteria group bacterium CG_4_10_14_0_8_um_filter_35_7]
MIGYLRGKIRYKEFLESSKSSSRKDGLIILEIGGVGWQIFVSPLTLEKINISSSQKEVELFTYLYVREDTLELYGFLNVEELKFFKKLIQISGVGPKSALGLLGVAHLKDIKEAIREGDPSILTKVSGIGKKMAGRIIVELKEKIQDEGLKRQDKGGAIVETIDALISLGYKAEEARHVLREIPKSFKTTEEKVKEALRRLGGR